MAYDNISPKLKEKLDKAKQATTQTTEQERPRQQTTTATKKAVEKQFDLDNNPFAKIMFDTETTDEQKQKAVAEALVYDVTKSKQENQERLKEFNLFKEYLQYERTKMAKEIIALSDTDAFSQLHEMYDAMLTAMNEYDEAMKPLTDILDAVFQIRTSGDKELALGLFQEIKNDELAAEERETALAEFDEELKTLKADIDTNRQKVAELKEKKKFILFGGPKDPGAIEKLEIEQEELKAKQAATKEAKEELKNSPLTESKYGEFANEKAKLKELLDISSEEHKERQQRVVAAATNFVETTEDRGGRILVHFDDLGEHLEVLDDANRGMQAIYGIVTQASADAARLNKAEREKLTTPAADETPVQKANRTNKKRDVEEYIANADKSAEETVKTYGSLTAQGVNIMTMKDANREQIARAKELTSSGVAGVADNLASVLSAVSAAALNESAMMAEQSVSNMNDRTALQNQQEGIRQAIGMEDRAAAMNDAIEKLAGYGATSKAVAEISEVNLAKIKDSQNAMKDLIDQTRKDIDDQSAVRADIDLQFDGASDTKKKFDKAATKPAANDDKKTKTGADSRISKFGQPKP